MFVKGSFPRQEHGNRLILSLHTWAPLLFKNLIEADDPNLIPAGMKKEWLPGA